MLDLATLRYRCSQGEKFQYLFFWGHQASLGGTINQSCLSQWFPALFKVEDITYPTAEHWMMASKARLFSDPDALHKIINCNDPKLAKAYGREVKNFDEDEWDKNCRRLIIEGNLEKFRQNASLRAFLVGTGSQILVEASPNDAVWGIGLAVADPRAQHPGTWEGQNLLGFCLMDVREALKNDSGV